MKKKNLSLVFAVGVIGIVLTIVLISGCVENQNKDVKSVIKENIKKEYDQKIIELRADALKTVSENEELIENETEEILKNITKDELLNNTDKYSVNKEGISYIKNMTPDEFEIFKERLRPYAIEAAKKDVMNKIKEYANEFNYAIIDIKTKDEIKDIDVYLDVCSISYEAKEDIKKKINNGTYIVIIEMNIGISYNVAEVCDKEGRIIK